jgi:hypothetical protein
MVEADKGDRAASTEMLAKWYVDPAAKRLSLRATAVGLRRSHCGAGRGAKRVEIEHEDGAQSCGRRLSPTSRSSTPVCAALLSDNLLSGVNPSRWPREAPENETPRTLRPGVQVMVAWCT